MKMITEAASFEHDPQATHTDKQKSVMGQLKATGMVSGIDIDFNKRIIFTLLTDTKRNGDVSRTLSFKYVK